MLKKENKSVINVSVCLSIFAVLISVCGLVYQFISKDNEYLVFIALLLSNLTVLVANLSTSKNKKDKKE